MLLTSRERHPALAMPGVKAVIPLVVPFAEWRKPEGGSTRVVVVGTDAEDGGWSPGHSSKGTWEDIKAPDGRCGRPHLPARARHQGRRRHGADRHGPRAGAGADGRHPFIHAVALRLHDAQSRPQLLGADSDRHHLLLVQVQPGADIENGARGPAAPAGRAEVLTKAGVPRPQPHAVAVPHGRRRGADRRRTARHAGRHGDRRADALFEHQGSPQRVRDAACAGVIVRLYSSR